ncbi:MAG: hypothetical protein K5849_06615 [Bacteroidales bacterium]|nr:hypothetical protein [Bacteroidales bacterium]
MKGILSLIITAALSASFSPGQEGEPLCYAYSDTGGAPFVIYTAPGSEQVLMTVPGKYDYDLILRSPQDGWWEVVGPVSVIGVPDEGDELDIELPGTGWIPAASAHFTTILRHSEELVFRGTPSDSAAPVCSMPPGEVWALHPLDISADGEWIQVQVAEDGPVGWLRRAFICISTFEMCEDGTPPFEDEEEPEDE